MVGERERERKKERGSYHLAEHSVVKEEKEEELFSRS